MMTKKKWKLLIGLVNVMMNSKKLLKRIDERDYLTEREHREFLEELITDLENIERYKKDLNELTTENEVLKKQLSFTRKKLKCEEYHYNKDLEILEIFKKHLNYSETKNLDTSIISKENYNITIFKALYEEDFEKIEEWLNDK